jgi:hypothetical protein
MSYRIVDNGDGTWSLEDESGTVISADNPQPCTTPDDVIEAILVDLGVTEPFLSAIQTALVRDWERIEK